MALDGLSLRAISSELKKLIGYKIDKVFEPTKNEILLGLYGEKTKFSLTINIDGSFYRVNLTTHPKPNPLVSLNFCMLLRKHIIGYKIKNIITYGLERIIAIELEPFEPYDENVKYLIIELMGKHSNIILTDNNNIIIDSIRHTNTSNNSYRNIFPKQPYALPKLEKLDFEKINTFQEFYNIIESDLNEASLPQVIANKFAGMSFTQINYLMHKNNLNSNSKNDIEKIYNLLKIIIEEADNYNLGFEQIDDKNLGLVIDNAPHNPFSLNFYVDDFYFEKETNSYFINYRNNLLRLILKSLNKYNKRLLNINNKLTECDNLDTYKLYGELLIANLYKYNSQHLDSVQVLNYNTNENITIPLDKKYTVNENSKRYFKKYNKLKNALSIVQKQKEDTILELNYIESIVFELENAKNLEEVNAIYDEISENIILKSKSKKAKKISKTKKRNEKAYNPLTFSIDSFNVFVGRNNKENDWLTTKFASANDLWFHTKDIHGSHVILKTNGIENIDEGILIECAKLAVLHSKAKNSSNVPVDYAKVKFVKKPNGSKPGMVVYTHNRTMYVNP